MAHFLSRRRRAEYDKLQVAAVFKELEAKIVRWNISTLASASTGATFKTVRQIIAEVGVLPRTHARALFTRGETQRSWWHARHRRRRAIHRRAAGHVQGIIPIALQLPALLGRRNGPHRSTRPPRNRSWQARLARDPSDAAVEGRVPLHHPHCLRDHRVQRLVLNGDGMRLFSSADGCRACP